MQLGEKAYAIGLEQSVTVFLQWFPKGSDASIWTREFFENDDESTSVSKVTYRSTLPNGEKMVSHGFFSHEWVGDKVVRLDTCFDFGHLYQSFKTGKAVNVHSEL